MFQFTFKHALQCTFLRIEAMLSLEILNSWPYLRNYFPIVRYPQSFLFLSAKLKHLIHVETNFVHLHLDENYLTSIINVIIHVKKGLIKTLSGRKF